MSVSKIKSGCLSLVLVVAACPGAATAQVAAPADPSVFLLSELDPLQQRAEDILRELVEYESTGERPDEVRGALEAIAKRLQSGGFPAEDVQLLNPIPDTWGLVARYRGVGSRRPLLTMAHVDVVTANPDAWAFPPFSFGKKDGFYFGRGTQDNKTGVAHILANFLRLREEGFVPNRDLVLLVTGDEETEQKFVAWVANEGRHLVDAELALNSDGGGGELGADGAPRAFWVQTSEKRYHTFRLVTSNPGGHSSLPRPDNAINQLARALARLADFSFPVELTAGSRLMFERSARLEQGQRAADMLALAAPDTPEAARSAAADRLSAMPFLNAIMRTTCVATGIEGGHAENALPRHASATVNCRMVPGAKPEDVQSTLEQVVDDPGVVFETVYQSVSSPPSALSGELLESFEALADEQWPGVPVIPQMSTGTTDGLFLRNAGIPVYGVAGWFIEPDAIRAHGLDEKIGIRQFHEGAEFWYRMLRKLSQ